MNADYELKYVKEYPSLVNDDSIAEVVCQCAAETVGSDKVVEPMPTMDSEDMAFFLQKTKGCFYFLGIGREGCSPLHSPTFNLNEDVLMTGVELYCWIALKILG